MRCSFYVLTMVMLLLSCKSEIRFTHNKPTTSTIFVEEPLNIDINNKKWIISEYLTGSHFVYAYEADNIYKDERIVKWMKESKVKVIRWPGGTAVQNYHWNDLNGIPFDSDTWDPNYNDQDKEKTSDAYMDLDEFIAFCKKVGAEPMVGVNIKSGKLYNREEDAKKEARNLIQYCKDKNYNVKYWYIGNEGYASGFGAKLYAQYIDTYAQILKEVDPNIEIIGDWKFGPEDKNRFNELLTVVANSKNIDIIEVHEKWAEGWGLYSGTTMTEWQEEKPLFNGKLTHYSEEFYKKMDELGKDVKLAMNEWGLGTITGASDFENGLVVADYMMEIFRNQISMACYWNLNIGPGNSRILKVDNYDTVNASLSSISVISNVFTLFSNALGKNLIKFDFPIEGVYGFATVNNDNNKVEIFLLNKLNEYVELDLNVPNFKINKISQKHYSEPGSITESQKEIEDGEASIRIPSMSLSYYVLE